MSVNSKQFTSKTESALHTRAFLGGHVHPVFSKNSTFVADCYILWHQTGSFWNGVLSHFSDLYSPCLLRSMVRWLVTESRNCSTWAALPLKLGPVGCPITSVTNYPPTLCNIQEEWRSYIHHGRSFQSCVPYLPKCKMNFFLCHLKACAVTL